MNHWGQSLLGGAQQLNWQQQQNAALAQQLNAQMRQAAGLYGPMRDGQIIPCDDNGRPLMGSERKQTTKKEEVSMFKSFKEYIGNHKDIIFTVIVALVVDKYLFNGVLKTRIQKLVEGLLQRAEKMIAPAEPVK